MFFDIYTNVMKNINACAKVIAENGKEHNDA